MTVVGCVLLVTFFVYDIKFARVPILSKQSIKTTWAIVAASWRVSCFLRVGIPRQHSNIQVSFYITFTYLHSFAVAARHAGDAVRTDWTVFKSSTDINHLLQTQTVGPTVFGLCAGAIFRMTHRYKAILHLALALCSFRSFPQWLLVASLLIRLLRVSLC